MADRNELQTARLLKEALKIVDELGKFNPDEFHENPDDELEKIQELIKKAKKLKKNRLWKLS